MHDGSEPLFRALADVAEARLAGFSPEGWPLVEEAGAVHEARALVPLRPADAGRAVAVAPMGAGGTRLILGLIQPPARVATAAGGEPVVIESDREVILRSGPASLTLFPDGRVEVRGTSILSRADGPNRIQGGSVNLN